MKAFDLDFERPAELQATQPPEARGIERDAVRLLVTAAGRHRHARFRALPKFLEPGTVLVVNRSATIPASLPAAGAAGPFRLNLSNRYGAGVWLAEPRWSAAEPGPLPVTAGERFVAGRLAATFLAPYPGLPRLWFVRIEGDVDDAMVRTGEPIRYGYLAPPYPALPSYQTVFGAVPGSAEMPSAGRPFTSRLVETLRSKDISIVTVVLHAGVSSLELDDPRGDDDGSDPNPLFPEAFVVPPSTARAVNAARAQGRPIIAVGTTVVRALESAWSAGRIRAVAGFTRRFVRPGRGVRIVDGLLTGLHDPRASHLALLSAIATPDTLRAAYHEAVREGYLWHEFGDSHLILPD